MKSNLLIKLALCILLAVLPVAESFAAAGKFNFVIGDVRIVGAAGERKAEKGGEIEANESIVSGKDGMAQLRMSDGAFIAVRADTELRIDQYQFSGKADASSTSILSLVKGTFRAFTGAIASYNKEKFLMKTPCATVGIRGSGNVLNFSPVNAVTINHTIEGSHIVTAVDPSGAIRTLVTMPGQTVQVNATGVMQFVPTPAFILNAATAAADSKAQQQQKKEETQQAQGSSKQQKTESKEQAKSEGKEQTKPGGKEQGKTQGAETKQSSGKQDTAATGSASATGKTSSTAKGDGPTRGPSAGEKTGGGQGATQRGK